jgi:hypothetical protein
MQMFMPKLCTKSTDNIPTIFADELQLIDNTENLESCLETPKHVRSASEARVYGQQWVLYDSKIGKRGGGFVGCGAYLAPPGWREPKKVGSGYVLCAVQRVSKTASKATENSGQSPRNLLCTGKIVVEVVEELPCVSPPLPPCLYLPPSQLEVFGELSISTQSGWIIAGAVSSRAACSPTAAAPPPSETEADDTAFPSLVASYYHPRPIFQARASRELL